VTRANIARTTAANDASILDIDPDWPHSWFSIELGSQLLINEQTVIDGYTQPGASANTNPVGQGLNSVLRIEINGAGVRNIRPFLDGVIHLNTSNSALRGLVVNRADGQSIQLRSGTGNTIAGNYIGTDVSGTHVFRTEFGFEGAFAGVGVDDNPANSTSGHRIGGVTPAARNLLSGNSAGVAFYDWASNIFVEGNLIGTNRAGTQALANVTGVYAAGATTVGGAAPGADNLISGNRTGVFIGQNSVVENNRIGTDVTGAVPVPNEEGIRVGGDNNVVRGNTIAFSRGIGVSMPGSATGNLLSQNSIISNALGIDLALDINSGADGVSLNDVPPAPGLPDQDTGANNGQNYPTITSALPVGGGVEVQGTLASTPNSSFRIEFFANRERDEDIFTLDGTVKSGMFAEGQTYVGFVAATTNASGLATFTANLPALPPDQDFITATATDVTNTGSGPRNNTSEFSPVYPLGGPSTIVTNTGDVGVGTLREAIIVSNLMSTFDKVTFNISASDQRHFYYQNDGVAGRVSLDKIAVTTAANDPAITDIDPDWPHSWYSIQPGRDLPEISDTITIDGYSQPGSSPNTLPALQALNTVLKIELDGANGLDSGLRLEPNSIAGLSRFHGLTINRWAGDGIEFEGTFGNVVAGCFIGTDISGTLDMGNAGFGVSMHDGEIGSIIGGTSPNDRNLISGNESGGINVHFHCADIEIQGNMIGGDREGELSFGNHGSGVAVDASTLVQGTGNNLLKNAGGGWIVTPPWKPFEEPVMDSLPFICLEEFKAWKAAYEAYEKSSNPETFDACDKAQNAYKRCVSMRYGPVLLAGGWLAGLTYANGNSPGLGIDLGDDGPTPNGPKSAQNYPDLSSATIRNGETTITGKLVTTPNTTFHLDFFSNTTLDPSGFGEGEVLLGSARVTTDAAGNAPINFVTTAAVPAGRFITATATRLFDHDDDTQTADLLIQTSEFSQGIIVNPTRGDYNANGTVDAADYVVWRNTRGQAVTPFAGADGSGNGVVDQADHDLWRANFGKTWSPAAASAAVLEPTAEGEQAQSITTTASSTPLPDGTHPNRAESTDAARHAPGPISREGMPRVAPRPALTMGTTLLPAATPHDDALLAWLSGNEPLTSAVNREQIDTPAIPTQIFANNVTAALDSNLDGLDWAFESIGRKGGI
jgi:hypothetical protein